MFEKFLNFVKPRSFSLISRIYMYGIFFFELCQKIVPKKIKKERNEWNLKFLIPSIKNFD